MRRPSSTSSRRTKVKRLNAFNRETKLTAQILLPIRPGQKCSGLSKWKRSVSYLRLLGKARPTIPLNLGRKMGSLTVSCRERWKFITRRPISDRGARTLDITVLSPLITLTGAFVGSLPRIVRYGLVSIGVGLLAWNAFNLIDCDGQTPGKYVRSLDDVREAGL